MPSVTAESDVSVNEIPEETVLPKQQWVKPTDVVKDLPDEPFRGVEKLANLHNSNLVRSIAYLNRILSDSVLINAWKKPDINLSICIGIVTSRRALPYIDMAVSSLMRGNGVSSVSKVELHIMNGDPSHVSQRGIELSKLSFITLHERLKKFETGACDSVRSQKISWMQIFDQCKNSTAKWTVAVEDDVFLLRILLISCDRHIQPN
jgi:hypothetical protein